MPNPLLTILKTGSAAFREEFPPLPLEANGLPTLSENSCDGCEQCSGVCPTGAITVIGQAVTLDRGRCIGCNLCVEVCPSGTIEQDRSTRTAVRTREELILSNGPRTEKATQTRPTPFLRSLHVREVSTGDSGSDAEAIASTNSQFDSARYGIQFVASPRFADALLVSGPVGKAMQEPLRRCYEAMSEPRLVIALGTSAISGGLFAGGYAEANGVDRILPVDCYIPGDPPHPWSVTYGLVLAMGRI